LLGIGQTVGNYRIVRRLGAGGMGVVYEAEHPLIKKRVALKVIHRELAQNLEVVTRFFNEARAVNHIGHEHVVDVSDFGQTAEGEHFLVMEMLVGESLADRLERDRRLPAPRALHIAAQIADGLAAAHAAGVVHRDLKPDNVFLVSKLGDPDFVKIVDFGLAKLLMDGAGGITKQGVILGTPEYMSPEQAESKKVVDARSDVWALGILLYQMLTGLLPFVGASMGEVLVKVVSRGAAPPRSVNAEIPPAVEQIVLKCLQKQPDARFQSMAELRAALLDPDRWLASAGAVSLAAGASTPSSGSRALRVPTASPQAKTLVGTGVAPAAPAPAPTITDERLPHMQPPAAAQNATRVLAPDVAAGPEAAARRRRARWAVGLAVGALVAGGAVTVALVAAGRDGGAPAAAPVLAAGPPPAPDAAPPPDAARPATVRVTITTDPAGATVYDDATGERLGVTPADVELPRDSGERVLRFEHPGCGTKKKAVRTSADAELAIMLEPLADRRPAPPPAPRPEARKRPVPDAANDLLQPTF
jgi:serine/threonine-protein kinase